MYDDTLDELEKLATEPNRVARGEAVRLRGRTRLEATEEQKRERTRETTGHKARARACRAKLAHKLR